MPYHSSNDLLVPLERGADVLERAPVGEVAEEVGNYVVLLLAPEGVQRPRLALVERDVPVLDPHPLPVDHRVVLAYVPGGEEPLEALDCQEAIGEPSAALADRQSGRLGQVRLGDRPRADHDLPALDFAPGLRVDARHVTLGA